RHVAQDHPLLAQPSQPALDRGRRQRDLFGELFGGAAGILLHQVEQSAIEGVEGHGCAFMARTSLLRPGQDQAAPPANAASLTISSTRLSGPSSSSRRVSISAASIAARPVAPLGVVAGPPASRR